MTSLIDGKHPKIVIIDYYDDLISQVDIYAEEYLEKLKKLAKNDFDGTKHKKCEDVVYDLNYQPDEKRVNKEDSFIINENINDYVYSERMKAIGVIKEIQKKRLEELKSSQIQPTSVEDALFGKQFCFLLKIKDENKNLNMKFRLLTLVVDFYLDKLQINKLE